MEPQVTACDCFVIPFSSQPTPQEFKVPLKDSNRLLDAHDEVNSWDAICRLNKSY